MIIKKETKTIKTPKVEKPKVETTKVKTTKEVKKVEAIYENSDQREMREYVESQK